VNKEEILAMEAGRELDALLAEKVMGLTGYDFDDTHWFCSTCKAWVHPAQVTFHEVHERCQTPVVADWCDEEGNVMPNYSTDISAAWEVFAKFDIPVLRKGFDQEDNDYYCCQIGDHYVTDKTTELAITKCALLAVMNS
jgi:hypothetical protein